ncbi:MAG TPA: NAD(P)H-dependent glycerol-3-phosphate dehydrogenase [Silvibacterium sp.]|nr:NAD(P)H-dependent glycerol-3-phosphate dehydrogenase [Silvibacterium sp.]
MSNIAVMGGGAWGTALALNLAQRGGHSVSLWTHSPAVAETIRAVGENTAFFPGVPLPPSIAATSNAGEALGDADIILSVMPSHHVRDSFALFAPHLNNKQIIVSATKGIEDQTGMRISEVIEDALAAHDLRIHIAVLSGPSFAQEVAAGSPTAVTIASRDLAAATRIQHEFAGPTLRLYTNEDVIGVELGGALKNVIAIAAGAVSGLALGHNSTAALVTRGIAEITRLAVACGGRRETLAGLSGLGDLVLTCTGSLSRNRWVGVELGKGRGLSEALAGLHGKVAEGVLTTSAALELARRHDVEMPITEQVHAILYHGKHPREAIQDLMGRPGRDE